MSANNWYETQASGIGARFRAELGIAVERLASSPLQFPVVFRDVRRTRLRRFPYSLFFRIEEDAILVVACFHGSRNPDVWQQRI